MQMGDARPESARGQGCLRPSKQGPSRPRKTTAPAFAPHPHPHPRADAGSRDRASARQVPGVKVEKAERPCLGAGLRGKRNLGKPGAPQTRGWGTATRGAWDQHSLVLTRSPECGDARGGVGKLSHLQNPKTAPHVLPLRHCRAPRDTCTHTLLWLVPAANFVRLEPLGTNSSPFPPFLFCPGRSSRCRTGGVLGFQTWERTVCESAGLASLGC